MKTRLENLIHQLQEVQTGKLWIGSNFERKLSQLDEKSAFKRPLETLHSVAEIISHLTFWRKEAILKIQTGSGSKTDDCEENWLSNEKLEKKGWKIIKAEYDHSLMELISLLKEKEDDFLDEEYYDTDFKGYYSYSFLINGMLHHDLYHLGQIGIVLKYLKENRS
ncbi:MAG: DinB family protein [Bacteroidia bacterium]